jgi:sulfite exporter TauE/SafE
MLWEWTTAIVVASLLGSGHCVGMCGPFAVLAAGGTSQTTTAWQRAGTLTSYHFGRLVTYLFLGAAMGGLGSVADGLAVSAGWTPLAARLVGGLMVVMGVTMGIRWWRGRKPAVHHSPWMLRWNGWLIRIRKGWQIRSAAGKAFSWGLISTWLPCGWLYVFAIAAAGAGGMLWGMVLMTAFWIGTLPLLSMVPIGAWWLASARSVSSSESELPSGTSHRDWRARLAGLAASVQPFVQPASACLLIAFGVFTATSRAEVSLLKLRGSSSQHSSGSVQDQLHEVIDQKLPCCEHCLTSDKPDKE